MRPQLRKYKQVQQEKADEEAQLPSEILIQRSQYNKHIKYESEKSLWKREDKYGQPYFKLDNLEDITENQQDIEKFKEFISDPQNKDQILEELSEFLSSEGYQKVQAILAKKRNHQLPKLRIVRDMKQVIEGRKAQANQKLVKKQIAEKKVEEEKIQLQEQMNIKQIKDRQSSNFDQNLNNQSTNASDCRAIADIDVRRSMLEIEEVKEEVKEGYQRLGENGREISKRGVTTRAQRRTVVQKQQEDSEINEEHKQVTKRIQNLKNMKQIQGNVKYLLKPKSKIYGFISPEQSSETSSDSSDDNEQNWEDINSRDEESDREQGQDTPRRYGFQYERYSQQPGNLNYNDER
ncbi:UNKNOWN [Stylonychia lemnae]|uniref:Uncharacterized protein n=1 Tax=Stylonychia lemnae TaxID=5949 RepID=A0A078AYB3_STYLE|nr:UNKNOWN [Stylonychia lemnae]|eukprot:CDW87390.1 UNKNOWN [Stylonychia lemnae]